MSQPFGFDEDEAPKPSIARGKKKGSGCALLLLGLFFCLFLFGAAGAAAVVYKIANPDAFGTFGNLIAKTDGILPPDIVKTDGAVKADGIARTDDGPKVTDKTDDVVRPADKVTNDASKKPKKDGKKTTPFSNDPFPRRALLIGVSNYLMFNTVHYGSPQDSFKGGFPGSSTAVLRDRLTRPPMNFPVKQVVELSDAIPPETKLAKAHSTQNGARNDDPRFRCTAAGSSWSVFRPCDDARGRFT